MLCIVQTVYCLNYTAVLIRPCLY